jgi:hypothetical protein
MSRDYTVPLGLLKLGALLNVYFLLTTPEVGNPFIVWPARILFAVSAYRCLFPVRYEHNIVFHDSIFSSIFLTRLIATFAEIAYIFLFSHVLRVLDTEHVPFVSALSWLMVAQVVISQVLVWSAVLTGRLALYFYEELGWALIFAANTAVSVYLYFRVGVPASHRVLLQMNLLFGAVYLPWQLLHLRMLRAAGRGSVDRAANGLRRAVRVRNRRTDADSWGGLIGLSWMVGYWAAIIPVWVYAIVRLLGSR